MKKYRTYLDETIIYPHFTANSQYMLSCTNQLAFQPQLSVEYSNIKHTAVRMFSTTDNKNHIFPEYEGRALFHKRYEKYKIFRHL